jgi:hypothetical protein
MKKHLWIPVGMSEFQCRKCDWKVASTHLFNGGGISRFPDCPHTPPPAVKTRSGAKKGGPRFPVIDG